MDVSVFATVMAGISREEYEKLGLQSFLKNPLVSKLKSEAKQLKKSHQQMRDDFIEEKLKFGGRPFAERVIR